MADRPVVPARGAVVFLIVAAATVAAVVLVMRGRTPNEHPSPLGSEFTFDTAELAEIDPSLIAYRQIGSFQAALDQPRGLAAGPKGRIYVAGDEAIAVFDPEGKNLGRFALDSEPQCLVVGRDGKLYVGMTDHVEVLSRDGRRIASWSPPAGKVLLTSIAAGDEDVLVADYAGRRVLRYDASGKLLGRIGQDADLAEAGFVVPSAHFDLAFGPDGLLRIVNPGKLRIEIWTVEGDREYYWGPGSTAMARFVGCCNPTNIAILSDGRIVTSEKGIARLKLYKADRGFGRNGVLECIVAGPRSFSQPDAIADLAADSADRILVLDRASKMVRIFARKPAATGPDTGATR